MIAEFIGSVSWPSAFVFSIIIICATVWIEGNRVDRNLSKREELDREKLRNNLELEKLRIEKAHVYSDPKNKNKNQQGQPRKEE